MQGKYKTKKCSKGIKKIKKASNGLQLLDETGNLTSGATQGLGIASGLGAMGLEGATKSKYDPKITSQLADENQALGRGIGAAAGQGLNLLVPGLGTVATPLLSSAGGAIQRGFQADKLKSIKKQEEFNTATAKMNEGIQQDLTSFQAKQYQLGGKTTKSKVIEIEGKKTPEIHTDSSFNIKNLGTTPHSKGGDKVVAEEGDIVFPTQNSTKKYNEIMTAIMKKDKYKLKKEQNKLPEDKVSKARLGMVVDGTDPLTMSPEEYERSKKKVNPLEVNLNPNLQHNPMAYSTGVYGYKIPLEVQKMIKEAPAKPTITSQSKASAKQSKGVSKGSRSKQWVNPNKEMSLAQAPDFLKTSDTTPVIPNKIDIPTVAKEATKEVLPAKAKGLNVDANSLMELAPIAYNLGQGLFGNTEKVNRREFNPEMENYVDTSQPTRRAINEGYKTNLANSRNLSGGLSSNMRANSQAAANAKVGQVNQVDSQEYGKQLDVNNRNIGRTNEAKLTNLGLQNQYDELDAMNRAKKGEALSQGLTELGDLGYRNKSDKNKLQAWKDGVALSSGTTSYDLDSDENGQNLGVQFNSNRASGVSPYSLLDITKKSSRKHSKGSKSIQVERKYKLKK